MIRLNTGSSSTKKSRSKRLRNDGNGQGGGSRKGFSSSGRDVDASFAGLIGPSHKHLDGKDDEGTHDDMYDDHATNPTSLGGSTADGKGKSTSSKVNKLFEELLGDGASAIGSVAKTKGDESTQMSSVLGPIVRAKDRAAVRGKGNELADIPEDRKGGREHVLNINSNNNRTLSQMKILQNQQQQRTEEEDDFDEDTYMTKPREITFDSNADDVSALFGGHGGASLAGGVESYMGTYANQRKNRQRHPAGGGIFGGGRGNNTVGGGRRQQHDEESRTGVTSILEEIGLRSGKQDLKDSFNDGSEDDKGHSSWRHSSRGRRLGRRRGGKGVGGGGGVKDDPESLLGQIRGVKAKTWTVLIVAVMFVSIQFSTMKKHDSRTMDHLNWRFQNHRYSTARDSASHSSGLSAGIRDIAMENVEGGGWGGEVSAGRRRSGVYDQDQDHRNSLTGDGLGDVLRKSVPLKREMEWEQDQIMMDDGIETGGSPNLRGGKRHPLDTMADQQRAQQQQQHVKQQPFQHQQHQQLQQQTQLQQAQSQQAQHQQNPIQPKKFIQSENTQQLQPSQMIENLGDTHPLLKPKKGLSMEDALTKLNVGSDKLSDLDPRPQQSLTNDMIPSRFSVFADLKTPYVVGRDTPFFWHIPRSGGVVVKTMLSHCLGQTLAAEVGELEGHASDSEIKVISFSDHNYTNVNVATPEGISRALNLGLVPSHLSDIIVSAHVDLVPSLFNANDRARAFVMFRHPVDRAASMFYFLQGTGYPPLKNMTVDDYAKSELIENNWLVRILSESMTGPIDMDNLEIAKEVLRRKFIVGLLDNKRGSFARFDHYFKWKNSPNYEKGFGCRKQLMDEKYVSKHPIRKDSDTWKLLHEQNRFDLHLYDFAKELFSQQSYIFGL